VGFLLAVQREVDDGGGRHAVLDDQEHLARPRLRQRHDGLLDAQDLHEPVDGVAAEDCRSVLVSRYSASPSLASMSEPACSTAVAPGCTN
jgi:hypothetical protein